MAINFFEENVEFNLSNRFKRKQWLKRIAKEELAKIGELNYIFCSDEYLHKLNVTYLNHDTYTDIITFDNSDKKNTIEGDVFISIDRIRENAYRLGQSEERELSRVICHGLFHLLGYNDKSEEESSLMRNKEEVSIQLFENF